MRNKEKEKEHLINELAELRQRVAELEKSELRHEQEFRALAKNTPDIIAQFDKELRHIYVNPAVERATGIPRNSFTGKTNRELGMPENLISLWDKALRTVFETGQETTIEFDFPTPGGQGYFESRIVPEFAKDGSVESVLVVSRNITERKRAEEALQESERKYRELVKFAPAGIYEVDFRSQRFISVNDAMCQLLGYTREELLAMNPFDLLNDRSKLIFQERITKWLSGETPDTDVEYTVKTKDGREIYAVLNVTFTSDANGQPIGATVIGHDITERKQAEEALRSAEAKFRILVEQSLVGIYITQDKKIMYVNPKLAEMLGYTQDEITSSKSVSDLIVGEDNDRAIENIRKRLRGEVQSIQHTFRGKRKDGTSIDLEVHGTRTELNGKTVVIGTALDITEHKQLESKLKDAAEKYSTLFDTTSDGIWIHNLQGQILEVNDAYCRMSGYTRDEITGMPISKLEAIETPDEIAAHIKEVIEAGGHDRFESQHRRKDGSIFDVDITALYLDRDGGRIAIFTRDITERKRAEEEIKRHNAILNGINTIFKAALMCKTEEELGRTCLRAAEEITGSKFGFIGEIGSDSLLHDIAISNPGWELCTMYDKRGHRRPPGDFKVYGLYGRVLLEGKSFLTNDPASHPDSIGTPEGHPPLSAFLGIPLIDGGKTIGMVGMGNRANGYRTDDLEALETLGNAIVQVFKRKRAEEALRKSEERFRVAQELSPDGFSILRPVRDAQGSVIDFTWVYANATMASITGIEQQTLAGRSLLALFPGHRGSPFLRTYQQVAETGETRICEAFYHGDGILSERWFRVAVLSMGDDIAVLSQDITDRKRDEEALRKAHDELELRIQERTAELQEVNKALLESEASYRELTESINEVFFGMDRELMYTYWNKASEALTGILAKDAVGKSLYELFPDIKGTKAEQFYIEALKMQQPQRFESQFQLRDKKFIFDMSAYPTKAGLSVIAKDITEKKMFEAHLLRAQRMESIGILAGGIAHNLNNMLTPMMMSLHMLKEKLTDEQSQKLLTILEQNSKRSADLIKQVLSFSRGVEGERAPLEAKHLISEIEKIAKETFPKNIETRTDIPKDLFTISGDATQLHQVIMNLCVNARDAMPDGGTLDVTASNFSVDENYARMNTEAKVGSYVAISVSDTGVGISPKVLDRIFEPFFTTKEFGKGTGLGLSTSLAIVKSHGGFIDVHSEAGKGAVFSVYLPAIKTEMQNVEEQRLELLSGHGELVLVVEDEDSVREVTVSTLEKHGYSVLAAENGARAVALYAQNMDKIRAILMDMMMPVMDGEASIRAIRKINPEVKVIVVSGLAEKDKLAKIESTHAHSILPKPYTAERLLKTMNETINAK